jgi:hypothetical protein
VRELFRNTRVKIGEEARTVNGVHVPTNHEVETFSGRFVDTSNPRADTIALEDIAHSLAATCRYGGHCKDFYSVAEHAVFCSVRLERVGYGRKLQLAALHHDDAEAYLGDIPRPMKPLLGSIYGELSDQMDEAVCEALELPFTASAFHDHVVKLVDTWALLVEARFLLPSQGKGWYLGEQGAHAWGLEEQPSRIVVPDYWLGGLTPRKAEKLYLNRHKELMPS